MKPNIFKIVPQGFLKCEREIRGRIAQLLKLEVDSEREIVNNLEHE